MSTSTIEFSSEEFNCPVANKIVTIEKQWRVLHDNSGGVHARAVMRTTCKNQDHCVVADHHSGGTTYDWTKCAYLNGRLA